LLRGFCDRLKRIGKLYYCPIFKLAEIKQAKVWQQLTNVLAKVWLDGSTIASFAKPNFSSGRTSNFDHHFLTSTKQLNRQRLSADGMLIPNLRQYSVVARKQMETLYTYIPSTDYISNLSFSHIETYSFQRGIDYKEKITVFKSDYDRLKVRKERRNNLTEIEENKFAELQETLSITQYLINENGQFHFSSKKTNTFLFNDPIVSRLIDILKIEIRDVPNWLCAPVYRDAIVFYNQENEIVSTLNLCLSCEYMETKMFTHINGDYETYDLLKRLFIDIGHNIEEPDKFVYEKISKLRDKHNNSNTL